jgi:hypothetical protein
MLPGLMPVIVIETTSPRANPGNSSGFEVLPGVAEWLKAPD